MTILEHPSARGRSMDAAVESFLSDLEHANRSPHTRRAYASDLASFCAYYTGPLDGITADTLRGYFATLSPAPPPDADCNTSPQGTVCRWSAPLASTNLHNWNSVTCDGFTIDYTFRAQRDYLRFYDAQGNATREIRHVSFSGTLINSTDASKTVPYEGHFTRTYDYGAETITFTGLTDHVIVPGLGAVNLDVGRSVRDATMPEFEDLLFSAGQWDANDATETPEELCRALS